MLSKKFKPLSVAGTAKNSKIKTGLDSHASSYVLSSLVKQKSPEDENIAKIPSQSFKFNFFPRRAIF